MASWRLEWILPPLKNQVLVALTVKKQIDYRSMICRLYKYIHLYNYPKYTMIYQLMI